MRITALPEVARYVLEEHREQTVVMKQVPSVADENELVDLPETVYGPAIEGAPVFLFKPLNPREKNKWIKLVYGGDQPAGMGNDTYIDIAWERLVGIENLLIGDVEEAVPFDKEKHFNDLELRWLMLLATHILNFSRLSDEAAGK